MAADINALAKQCGVSKATISRVFTGRARVSPEVRERVLAAARELNYRPQQVMARDCVAIVVNDLPNPARRTSFSERLLTSAVFEITRRGLLSEIISANELPRLYGSYTRAVLILLSEPQIEEHLAELEGLPMPVLTVNKEYPRFHSITTDHGEGVRLALEHLHANGHRRIALTVDQTDNLAGRERLEAYCRFMADAGFEPLEPAKFNDQEMRESNSRFRTLLRQSPTALVACGEGVALPVFHGLQRLGYRIPEDISLVTSELAGISGWMTPELTTIDQELDSLARAVTARLAGLTRNPGQSIVKGTRLPTRLRIRKSVRKLP